jgi:hypothetical protein
MGRNLQKLALWTVPLAFVAVLFYWAMVKLLGLGLQQDWLAVFSDAHFHQVVWFTIGQAAFSTLLCLMFGIPGAFVLYRRKFFGQSFVKAFIAVPFVLPTIVVAIALQSFASSLPTIWVILIAHLFLNYSIVVRTVGGVWQLNTRRRLMELINGNHFGELRFLHSDPQSFLRACWHFFIALLALELFCSWVEEVFLLSKRKYIFHSHSFLTSKQRPPSLLPKLS